MCLFQSNHTKIYQAPKLLYACAEIFSPRHFWLFELSALHLSTHICNTCTYTFSCSYYDALQNEKPQCNCINAANLQNLTLHASLFSKNILSWPSVYRCMHEFADVQLRYLVVIFTRVAASNFKCSSHRFVYFLWFSTNASFFDRLHDFSNVVFCWSICARFLNLGRHVFLALLKSL